MAEANVRIRTSKDDILLVEASVASQIPYLHKFIMMANCETQWMGNPTIPVNYDERIMLCIINWCRLVRDNSKEADAYLERSLENKAHILELARAAEYLGMSRLIEACSALVAKIIENLSIEEIREMFGSVKTPMQ